ncbi:MAG: hypothetical protein ACI90V_010927 [Bacillariaceae sp.]
MVRVLYYTFHYDDDNIENPPLHCLDFIGLEDFFIKSSLDTKQDYVERRRGNDNGNGNQDTDGKKDTDVVDSNHDDEVEDKDRKLPAIINKREKTIMMNW